jgi:SAM-dependent methyltransferase
MHGKEVVELQQPDNQIKQDQDKSKEYIIAKMHIFNVAFHNMECSHIKDWDKDQYGFIPFPCGSFADILIEASVYYKMDINKRFLDVGCGPGTKLLMAKSFFKAEGIEVVDRFIQQSKAFGLDCVHKQDALEYEHYGDFDVIYFYRPFKNNELQKQLEDRIYSQMKVGALLAPMNTVTEWSDISDIEKLSKFFYRKNAR